MQNETDFSVAAESVFGENRQRHDKVDSRDLDVVFEPLGTDTVSFLPVGGSMR